jgi:RHS repeat-associated protein
VHASSGVRVTADPFGTGGLSTSSGPRVLGLHRLSNATGPWSGAITVIECTGDESASGFRLLDVKTLTFNASQTIGDQVVTATCAPWTDLSRVAMYGGWNVGGGTTHSASLGVRGFCIGFEPSGDDQLTGSRWVFTASGAPTVYTTVYVVQWGTEHQLQRLILSGTSGGDDLDAAGEWQTAGISPVVTRESWVTASGWAKATETGAGYGGTVVTLGTGLSPMPDVASTVAIGSETSSEKKLWVTVHRHPGLVAHHVRTSTSTSTAATWDAEVAPPGETDAERLGVTVHSHGAADLEYARSTWWSLFAAATTLRATRVEAAGGFVGWASAVDLCRITHASGSGSLHVTRTVLDLLDRVVEVWDARGLTDATWKYTHDRRGQRWKVEHTTGTGIRYGLPDSAGNPIWSRDGRSVEVERTFDGLNRPLAETVGGGLRRGWAYVAYNAGDTASQAANLFGRVEEERDQDGIRFFEYDWRGLPTKVSHRFWPTDGTLYTATEDTISSAARGSIGTWLTLTGLSDTTTVVCTTVYDAAGRPTSEVWPLLSRSWSYNSAGTLQEAGYDDGTAKVGVNTITYNARGQVTGWTHGSGVTTTREYDSVTERLTRIFVKKPSPESRFQDLAYAYDPVGNPVLITDQLATSTFTANSIIPNTRRFAYDPRYRLVGSTGKRHKNATDGVDAPVTPSPAATDYVPYTHRYSHDAVGNFTTNQEYSKSAVKYKAGLPDRFDGVGAESYGYDDNGCVTSTPRHTSIGYQFDAQPTLFDLGGGGKIRLRRHGDQRVVRFRSATNAIRITLGAFEYEKTAGYTKVILHLQGPAGRCAQVEKLTTGTDSTSLPVFHVHGDHLGSGQALTKADGTLLSQEEFFAYGRSSDRRDTRNRYRFIGVERDEDTGLCMTGPRTYDPVTGRFLQGDPVVGGAAYVYSRASPIGRRDGNGYADEVPLLTTDAWTPGSQVGDLRVPKDQQQELWAKGVRPPDNRPWVDSPLDMELLRDVWASYVGSGERSGKLDASGQAVGDDCFLAVLESSKKLGFSGPGRNVHQGTYSGPPTANQTIQLLDAIDKSLAAGRPVALGVDHDQKFTDPSDSDHATDHWVLVVGRTYAKDGTVEYVIVDNATNERAGSISTMYVKADLSVLHKPKQPWVDGRGSARHAYTATNASSMQP